MTYFNPSAMQHSTQARQADRLIFLGILLFFLGLAVGLVVQQMKNPRMALAAHLEGVMNGMFMVILGLIWGRLVLSARLLKLAFGLVVYGTFANLVAVLTSAATGFGKMLPIAGGKEGASPLEGLITFLLITLALSMLAACGIVLLGYYRHMQQRA